MFWIKRRRPVEVGVQFCDSCVEVTTAAQRADTRYDRNRTAAYTWAGIR
ncbi:hypothetical protein GCM10009557_59470 [Virgisporangium ochraceum]|uniref:Uncharacterized protein n=1 Tax=Virgisporangium ochraceum TaxID=65505 RepID=A0A8J3ZQU2_9ACTN|nr:hypothetical protein [Virgisporangium ochraceum]GIJ68219.1 hypothetical protein Voc01_031360 [Virgisporangium ochraceum]